MGFARTVIEHPPADQELDQLHRTYERFEEFWEGRIWLLARNPLVNSILVPDSNPPAYMVKAGDLSFYNLPPGLTILYRFTDEEVIIHGVRVLQ
jgi:hypothetical protein